MLLVRSRCSIQTSMQHAQSYELMELETKWSPAEHSTTFLLQVRRSANFMEFWKVNLEAWNHEKYCREKRLECVHAWAHWVVGWTGLSAAVTAVTTAAATASSCISVFQVTSQTNAPTDKKRHRMEQENISGHFTISVRFKSVHQRFCTKQNGSLAGFWGCMIVKSLVMLSCSMLLSNLMRDARTQESGKKTCLDQQWWYSCFSIVHTLINKQDE